LRIPISQQTRQEVIAKWLSGWPRDKIAGELGIGAGTVSNIVNLWIQEVGAPTAESFRELSLEIRRSGISIRECARGLRFVRFLQGISGDEETKQFEIFLEKIYNKSKYFNVSPENLVEIASEIWELSKTMPTTEISSYLNAKMKEKSKIEGEIFELNRRREIVESDLNRRLQASQTELQELQNFVATRQYFANQGVDINNLHHLTIALQNATLFNFDVKQMAQKISDNISLNDQENNLRRIIAQKREELGGMEQSLQIIETDLDEIESKWKYSKELESMGFGMHELTELKRMLVAIIGDKKQKDTSTDTVQVVKSFFTKIEELHNIEEKLESLKEEVCRIEEIRKSQIDEMEKFMGNLKANIQELSGTAIQAIKMAFSKGEDAVASENSDKGRL
jgi:hypothetical protein